MKLLTDEDRKAIEEAIKNAEAKTSGEIVFALAEDSAHYHFAVLQGALLGMSVATAIYLALPLSHSVAGLLWTEFISFAVLYAAMPHIPWRRYLIPKREMDQRVHEAAFMQFYSSGLYRTKEENGIEIFLSCFERKVVVIADRGIHQKMGDAHWDEVRNRIIQGIREGKAREGICSAIEICGKALGQHFPHRADDINELPDQIIDSRPRPDAP
jgi:putative membrane protein